MALLPFMDRQRRTIRLPLFSKETRKNTKERAKGLEMAANHKVVDRATTFFFREE